MNGTDTHKSQPQSSAQNREQHEEQNISVDNNLRQNNLQQLKISSTVTPKVAKSVKISDGNVGIDQNGDKSYGKEAQLRRRQNTYPKATPVRSYPPPFYYNFYGANIGSRRPVAEAQYFRNSGSRPLRNNAQRNGISSSHSRPIIGQFKGKRRNFLSAGLAAETENRKSRSISGSKDDLTLGPRRQTKSHYRNRSSHSESACQVDHAINEGDLEEPFSESEGEEDELSGRVKMTRKNMTGLTLPIAKTRVRTLSGMVPKIGYAPLWGGPTMCLGCFDFFDIPAQTGQYVEHLLSKHQIVIADINLIVDLKRYIEYWRHRFGSEPIDKIFPRIIAGENDPYKGKLESYYLMSEQLPEDRKVRESMAMRRLEEVLACQQRERDDSSFSRQCLFCRYHATGNRAKLIHHLYMIHHLNLGSPDNLVFVNEYLDILEDKLKNGICIYCEQKFDDPGLLDEHMRKRGHREVNPENNYYDKFYMINYLELGKKWVDVLAEDFEDTMPTFADSEEEEEEESWNEWQEDALEEERTEILCLLCDDVMPTLESFLQHLNDAHSFDLKREMEAEKMDFYDRMRFINYIRSCCYNCVCFTCGKDDLHSWPALRKHLADPVHPNHVSRMPSREKWDKDEYLIPTFENDALLWYLDELDDDQNGKATLPFDPAILDNGPVISDAQSVNSDRVVVLAEDVDDLTYTVLSDHVLRGQLH